LWVVARISTTPAVLQDGTSHGWLRDDRDALHAAPRAAPDVDVEDALE
jgi:hypothetical protein